MRVPPFARALTAAVAIAGVLCVIPTPTFAAAVGELTIDFEDNSLVPYLVTGADAACAAGSVTASGGKMVFSRPAGIGTNCANSASLGSAYEVCGDFDIQVDFNLGSFPTPSAGRARYTTFYVWDKGGAGYLGIERFLAASAGGCLPYADSYKIFHNTTDGCVATYVPSSQTSGKLRIARTGTTWRAYYWTGSSWALARTVTGTVGPAGFSVYSGGNSPEAQLVTFDNIVIQSAAITPSSAPVTWPGNGHSYQVVHAPCGITRAAANAAALAAGGYLATIASEAENDFVFSLISGRPELWYQDTFSNGLGPWLGAIQPSGSTEPLGGWTWANAISEPFGFSSWAPGEPNNAFGGEEALHFFQAGALIGKQWNDANSNAHIRGYVIEYEVPFGNHCDNFDNGTINTTRFTAGPSCGTVTETAGQISIVNPAGCGFAGGLYSKSDRRLRGDFDVQVDFQLLNFGPSSNAHRARVARLLISNGMQEAVIERYTQALGFCNPGVHNYKAWIATADNCAGGVGWAATSDMTGRLRVARVGSTLTLYYWQSGWVVLKSGGYDLGPVYLALDSGAPGNFAAIESSHEARFDNLCVTSAGDTGPPVVIAPADVAFECASAAPPASADQATATDDQSVASLVVTETSNGGAGTPVSPLILTRVWTATDTAGNSSSDAQIITVIDDTAPVLTLPSDVSVSTGPGTEPCADARVVVEAGLATATDNCGTTTVSVSGLPEGGAFPTGETLIVWTATDAAGNSASGTQRVIVTCPIGNLSGLAVLTCNGQSQPAANVTVNLLHEGSPYLATTTGAAGDYRFDGVRQGTYTVGIEAPAGYAVAPDTRVILLDANEVAVERFNFTCLLSDLTGQVTGTCNGSASELNGVTVDLFRDDGHGMDVLVATTATDASGRYRFDDLALGQYTIGIVLPLGYAVGNASQTTNLTTPDGLVNAATFALTCQPIVAEPRAMGYWKHQVNVYLTGKGSAQEPLAALLHYIDEMVEHFNENLVNPVIVYVPVSSGTQDKLLQLQQLLTVNKGGTMLERAKQQLLALLLNVTSGKISQTELISDNGASVSQAITHAHDLIVDGVAGTDETAKTICDLINNGQRVPAGMVPTSVRVITYQAGANDPDLAFGIVRVPNPVRGAFQVELAMPEAGHVVLEMLDIAGRRVWRESLDLGVGRNVSRVGAGANLPPGVYRLRLRNEMRAVTRSVVVVQ